MEPKKDYYAVRIGLVPGIYGTWGECENQVKGFPGAVFKKFKTSLEANAFMKSSGGGGPAAAAAAAVPVAVPNHPQAANAPAAGPSPGPASNSTKVAAGMLYSRCKCGLPMKVKVVSEKNAKNNAGRLYVACGECKMFMFVTGDAEISADATASLRSAPRRREGEQRPRDGETVALRIYTDGACKDNQNVREKVCKAGWGVAIYRHEDDELIEQLYGPVELNPKSSFYMNAEVGSNNTAELSALGECLYWILEYGTLDRYPGSLHVLYDSEYAYKSMVGLYNGEKNVSLCQLVRLLYKEASKKRPASLFFSHVKGHSGNVGNDMADHLANRGAAGELCKSGRFAGSVDFVGASSASASAAAAGGGSQGVDAGTGSSLKRARPTFEQDAPAGGVAGDSSSSSSAAKKSMVVVDLTCD